MLYNPKVKSMFNISFDETNFVTDISAFQLRSEKLAADRVTFGKYTAGTAVKWSLRVFASFDGGSADSLHAFLWENAGQQVDFLLKPFQEVDPDTKRFYLGTVRIPYRPDIKVKAGNSSTYDYIFKVIGQPARGDAPNGFMTEGYYDEY